MLTDWFDAWQVLDSSFPSGAYVHSFGLESLAPGELEAALTLRVQAHLARLELVFLRHAYTEDLMALDECLHAMLLVREPRDASAAIGTHLLRAACDLFVDERLHMFLREGRHRHHPVAFGGIALALGIPDRLAAEAYAFGSMRGQVSAAQRLGWIGQRDAQRTLHALKPAIRAAVAESNGLSLDEAGAFAPTWDIASMAHERADSRMFAS
jgi:urease accessory protein